MKTDSLVILNAIAERALAIVMQMIDEAGRRPGGAKGDPKVGGHPSACASSLHILGALHLVLKTGQDHLVNKPHASPVDHAYNYLLGLFLDKNLKPLSRGESVRALKNFRAFGKEGEYAFQSYHSAYDPDAHHFLPSGTVGIPPVVLGYLALAYRLVRLQGYKTAPAHFWAVMGDSEFREGSLMEAAPDLAERELGNLTWIVDYNRQSLDGHRLVNEDQMQGCDALRIENTLSANGWDVIQVQHGLFRQKLFQKPGGPGFKLFLERELKDIELQEALLKRAEELKPFLLGKNKNLKPFLNSVTEGDLKTGLEDLGGHDFCVLVKALQDSKNNPKKPCCVIAHTIKGWGLQMAARAGNHSALVSRQEMELLKQKMRENSPGSGEEGFALFAPSSKEGKFLKNRGQGLYKDIVSQREIKTHNQLRFKNQFKGLGDSLDIDFKRMSYPHTQWFLGQVTARLARLAGEKKEAASVLEGSLKAAGQLVFTLSPDVGTSTNLAASMNHKVFGPSFWKNPPAGESPLSPLPEAPSPPQGTSSPLSEAPSPPQGTSSPPRKRGSSPVAFSKTSPVDSRVRGNDSEKDEVFADGGTSPVLWTDSQKDHRFLRFEIAEANSLSCMAALGKMDDILGVPALPLLTVYDFFIKRALDQFFYALYLKSGFILCGTPSGVSLSPEGAQHCWKSDFQIPGQITWEPCFLQEMDWIMAESLNRHFTGHNEGRAGVLIRAVTKGVDQKQFMKYLKTQKRFSPESGISPADVLRVVRDEVLKGAYYLLCHKGYRDYTEGDNVVNVFAMGALVPQALEASQELLKQGIYANVIVVTSPDLLLGNLAHTTGFDHLKNGLQLRGASEVPVVSVHDGEPGLLDNVGSVLGVYQESLAVRKHSLCGTPKDVYAYHGIDGPAVVKAAVRVLGLQAQKQIP